MFSHWSDVAAVVSHVVLVPAGLIANTVLVVLTIYSTPKSLKTYSAILVVSAIGGILVAIGACNTQARTILHEDRTVVQFVGPSMLLTSEQETNADICMFWYHLQVFTGMFLQMLVILSAIFRVGIFKYSMESVDKSALLYPLYVIGLLWVALSLITSCFTLEPYAKIKAIVFASNPLKFENESVYYTLDTSSFPHNVLHTQRFILPWLVLVFTVFGRWMVGYQLDYYKYSNYVKKHHIAIATALFAQCIPAILSILINITYPSLTDPQSCPVCENFLNFPIIFMSVFNPAATLFFIIPYHAQVRYFIRKRSNPVVTPTTVLASRKHIETMRF